MILLPDRRPGRVLPYLAWSLIVLIFLSGAFGLYFCRTVDVPSEQQAEIGPQLARLETVSWACMGVSVLCAALWLVVGAWKRHRFRERDE